MKLVERGQQTLDEIENGHMSPFDVGVSSGIFSLSKVSFISFIFF